jgi:CRP-like cAMP-binding protein
MPIYLHLGNILFLGAYLVRDILWLRVITVVATLSLVMYYYCCHATPMYEAIAWNSVFILVNVVQITLLFFERCPVYLGEEELRIYRSVFKSLTPREFVKLVQKASTGRVRPGEVLLEQGAHVDNLTLLVSGLAAVEVQGRRVAEVGDLQFLGEMAFLTQQPASARVVALERCDFLAWPIDDLRRLLESHVDLDAKIQRILGADLVSKLQHKVVTSDHPSFAGKT